MKRLKERLVCRLIGIWVFGLVMPFAVVAQFPDSSRLSDWYWAGSQSRIAAYHQVFFVGDSNAAADNSPLLQQLIQTAPKPAVILLPAGRFYFRQPIELTDSILLKGPGSRQTRLLFDLSGQNTPCIRARGSMLPVRYPVAASVGRGQKSLQLTDPTLDSIVVGAIVRLVQQDADLMEDDWAYGQSGQMLRVTSVIGDSIGFQSALRRQVDTSRQPVLMVMVPKRAIGLECFAIERIDSPELTNQSVNISLERTVDAHITGVESRRCHLAHIRVEESSSVTIRQCYLHEGWNYGGGGNAYGVLIQHGSGEVLVEDNIFRSLRHAMLLQSGANGNVLTYNYSFQSRKLIFPNINVIGEDLDCHGNFPYANLFEGNAAQFASVDNSHGRNGPYNTYFRNRITGGGLAVTNALSDSQTFVGNHRVSGPLQFKAANHLLAQNSWQSSSNTLPLSLFYPERPTFLPEAVFGRLGPPRFSTTDSLPAQLRAASGMFTGENCLPMVWRNNAWERGIHPTDQTGAYEAIIYPPEPVIFTQAVALAGLQLQPGAACILVEAAQLFLLREGKHL